MPALAPARGPVVQPELDDQGDRGAQHRSLSVAETIAIGAVATVVMFGLVMLAAPHVVKSTLGGALAGLGARLLKGGLDTDGDSR